MQCASAAFHYYHGENAGNSKTCSSRQVGYKILALHECQWNCLRPACTFFGAQCLRVPWRPSDEASEKLCSSASSPHFNKKYKKIKTLGQNGWDTAVWRNTIVNTNTFSKTITQHTHKHIHVRARNYAPCPLHIRHYAHNPAHPPPYTSMHAVSLDHLWTLTSRRAIALPALCACTSRHEKLLMYAHTRLSMQLRSLRTYMPRPAIALTYSRTGLCMWLRLHTYISEHATALTYTLTRPGMQSS
jgi:hypothetical protein